MVTTPPGTRAAERAAPVARTPATRASECAAAAAGSTWWRRFGPRRAIMRCPTITRRASASAAHAGPERVASARHALPLLDLVDGDVTPAIRARVDNLDL